MLRAVSPARRGIERIETEPGTRRANVVPTTGGSIISNGVKEEA
jgi:hypothetical protein